MRDVLGLIILIASIAGSVMYGAHRHRRLEEHRLAQDALEAAERRQNMTLAAEMVRCHADLADQVVGKLSSCPRPVPEPILETARQTTADLRALENDLRARVA